MAMTGYTKLFNSILASTIWREDDKTRLVWITLLALTDKNGVVEASIPGLADLARVSLEDCERALANLHKPDKYSRSKDHDGRRIETVDGGWLVLNRAKYRDKMSADDRRERDRDRQRRHRQMLTVTPSVTHVCDSSRMSRQTETETETEKETKANTRPQEPSLTTAKATTRHRPSRTEGFNSTDVAWAGCLKNGWSGLQMIEALKTAIEFKVSELPECSLEQVGEWLVKAFFDHESEHGKFAGGPLAFLQQAKYPHNKRRPTGSALPAATPNDPAAYARAAMEGD
jgi:hypothetical protein